MTQTREQWVMSHANAVLRMAARDGTPPLETFARVRYMITSHGVNTFGVEKDFSGLVEAVLNVFASAFDAPPARDLWSDVLPEMWQS